MLDGPALPDQSQHGFQAGTHVGEEYVHTDIKLSLAGLRVRDHLHDPGASWPDGLDVLRGLPDS